MQVVNGYLDGKGNVGAILSEDRAYRYALWRAWGNSSKYMTFIGLNPSTADETEDDPTIRRCKGFASSYGYGALVMVNLFAVRATSPKDMMEVENPVGGMKNYDEIRKVIVGSGAVVCAWGNHGSYLGEGRLMVARLRRDYPGIVLKCLGITKQGQPKHPLYLPSDTNLEVLSSLCR